VRVARVQSARGRLALAVAVDEGVRLVEGGAEIDDLVAVLTAPDEAVLGVTLRLDEVRFRAPVQRPPSIRDFMVFEDHVANARQRSGRDVPVAWYDAPAFYFTNPAAVAGHDDEVRAPRGARALDLELEVACLVGRAGGDLDPQDGATLDHIAGFMLMNDWSARDLQVNEMPVGLGPVKGKDFCTSLGPWVVTPNELPQASAGLFSCRVDAYVNDRHVGGADLDTAHFTWVQMLARASENTTLVPGDILGSGTVGTGCLLELRELGHKDTNPWLRPGDVVELRGGPLGVLRNVVASSSPGG